MTARTDRVLVALAAAAACALLACTGCRPDPPPCPTGTVPVWHDNPRSPDPDVGHWECQPPPRPTRTGPVT